MQSQQSFSLLPEIQSRYSADYVRQKIRQADLIVTDLDQCIFPGYSQVYIGALITLKIFFNPEYSKDRFFLPALLAGGIFFISSRLKNTLGITTSNKEMIERYEAVMKGIPQSYFLWAAKNVPLKSYPGAINTLAVLCERAPLHIISLGPDVVLHAYKSHLISKAKREIFYHANTLIFKQKDGRVRFCAYSREHYLLNGEQKREILKKRVEELKSAFPVVIGHNTDDCLMAGYARAAGGMSVGFNPAREICENFDIIIRGKSWLPLLRLVKDYMQH